MYLACVWIDIAAYLAHMRWARLHVATTGTWNMEPDDLQYVATCASPRH